MEDILYLRKKYCKNIDNNILSMYIYYKHSLYFCDFNIVKKQNNNVYEYLKAIYFENINDLKKFKYTHKKLKKRIIF